MEQEDGCDSFDVEPSRRQRTSKARVEDAAKGGGELASGVGRGFKDELFIRTNQGAKPFAQLLASSESAHGPSFI